MISTKKSTNAGLVWITGFSGAGKTTVARLVFQQLQEQGMPTVFLDGDEIRSILGERFGHQLEERRKLASVYARLCKTVIDSGVSVVIATVAMFESVRAENRSAIDRYLEVYLKVPFDVLCERDPKGIYKAAVAKGGSSRDIFAGFEEPASPDLLIENFGGTSAQEAATLILQGVATRFVAGVDANSPPAGEIYRSRQEYWDGYYQRRKAPINPSSFALFCSENYIKVGQKLLEFGCGNGRDSFFFATKHSVIGVDASSVVVSANNERAVRDGINNVSFFAGEFGQMEIADTAPVDAVYARFVMHAMSEVAEDLALEEAWRILKDDGLLLLEFRTDQDPLMKQGSMLSSSERVTDHYRRFINFSSFCKKLENKGFAIEYATERQGLAPFGNDDPVVGRVVAQKKNHESKSNKQIRQEG